MKETTREVFDDNDGTLLGWETTMQLENGARVTVYVPRKERHVEDDRALIARVMDKVGRSSGETGS